MKKGSSGGCGSFLFMLFFVFLILKVSGAVGWSWWWVTAPLWMPGAFVLVGLLVMAVLGVGAFKIVGATFRRQTAGNSWGPRAGADTGDVLDAEGAEVPRSSSSRGTPMRLPAPGADATESDAPGGGSAGDEPES